MKTNRKKIARWGLRVGVVGVLATTVIPLRAQDSLSLSEYRHRVCAYSYTLKIAAQRVAGAEASRGMAHTALLPELSATGDFSLTFKSRYGVLEGTNLLLHPYAFALQPSFVQNLYQGGTLRSAYAQARLEEEIARKGEESSRLEVRYLAEYNYWNLASSEALLRISARYEAIVRSMYAVVKTRFEDGYVAKNDLLMIETRLREAEYSRAESDNLYRVALQNFNILMGEPPDAFHLAADSVTSSIVLPLPLTSEEVFARRPDYSGAARQIDYDRLGVRTVNGRYLPQVSAGVEGVWRNRTPNYGGGDLDGLLFLRVSVPIFHWGERRYAVTAAQTLLHTSEYALAQLSDQITQQVREAWTNMVQASLQIRIAGAALEVARENLSLNTFSYQEGVLTILDVISAQLSWLQAYTNIITSHFNQKIALAAYRKAVGEASDE